MTLHCIHDSVNTTHTWHSRWHWGCTYDVAHMSLYTTLYTQHCSWRCTWQADNMTVNVIGIQLNATYKLYTTLYIMHTTLTNFAQHDSSYNPHTKLHRTVQNLQRSVPESHLQVRHDPAWFCVILSMLWIKKPLPCQPPPAYKTIPTQYNNNTSYQSPTST